VLEGRITGEKIKALSASRIDFLSAERIFLCGPGSLIKDARDSLVAIGVASTAIAFEFFAAGGGAYRASPKTSAAPAKAPATGRAVSVILDGIRHQLLLADGETVLQAALKAGLKAPYACSGGMCSTCRARVVSGAAHMLVNYSLEPWEIEKGFTLACQAVPTTDPLVLDWDAM
jgi:ring-1,2-phenylacetyl-CoA epoxidase subunit PaaE